MSYVYWSLELYTSTWILMPWFNYTYPLIFVHWSLAWALYTDPLSFSFVYWSSDFIYYREKKAIALYHDMRQAGKSKKKLSRLELQVLRNIQAEGIISISNIFHNFLFSSIFVIIFTLQNMNMAKYVWHGIWYIKCLKWLSYPYKNITNSQIFTECKKVMDKRWHS